MVSKPCEHSGIACRPAKYAGTCDFSSLALLFGQVLFGNIYAFFIGPRSPGPIYVSGLSVTD